MCNDILRRDNNNPDALYAKAISYYYQDMQDKANSFFQRALRADPDHRKSRLAMKKSKKLLAMKEEGNMAFRQGRMEEAHHLYSEALTVDPLNTLTNAKLHCNRALVGSKIGKLEESIEDCTKAVELDPNYVKAFQRRAKLLVSHYCSYTSLIHHTYTLMPHILQTIIMYIHTPNRQ
jgi:DnaJ family protein C protein 7